MNAALTPNHDNPLLITPRVRTRCKRARGTSTILASWKAAIPTSRGRAAMAGNADPSRQLRQVPPARPAAFTCATRTRSAYGGTAFENDVRRSGFLSSLNISSPARRVRERPVMGFSDLSTVAVYLRLCLRPYPHQIRHPPLRAKVRPGHRHFTGADLNLRWPVAWSGPNATRPRR